MGSSLGLSDPRSPPTPALGSSSLTFPDSGRYRHIPGDVRSREAEEKDQEEKGQGWLEQGERRREMLSNYEEVF